MLDVAASDLTLNDDDLTIGTAPEAETIDAASYNSETGWGYTRILGGLTKVFVSMQKNTGEALERYFTALSLPTRSDVLEVGLRLSVVESRLAAMETLLARMAGGNASSIESVAAVPRPPRTKKPNAAKGGKR